MEFCPIGHFGASGPLAPAFSPRQDARAAMATGGSETKLRYYNTLQNNTLNYNDILQFMHFCVA